MNITSYKSQIKTLRHDDPRFTIKDRLIISPRAGFEINEKCPREYRLIIQDCIDNGWLLPVAHVTERELLFIGLSNEN